MAAGGFACFALLNTYEHTVKHDRILGILLVIKVVSICNALQGGWTARDIAKIQKKHVIAKMLKVAEEVCREI